jgi:hypothetical protein
MNYTTFRREYDGQQRGEVRIALQQFRCAVRDIVEIPAQ